MNSNSVIELNSTEISSLWLAYLNDSMMTYVIKYFQAHVNDPDIRSQLNAAYNISDKHLKAIDPILINDGLSLPVAFSDSDIALEAPKLYSDTFYLFYLANMARYGMTNFSLAFYNSARTDVRKFYADSLNEIIQFYYNLSEMMLSKGVYLRSPIVEVENQSDSVDKSSFFAGILTHPRPLLLVEISNIWSNILTCMVGQALIQGFSQAAKSDALRKYFSKGKKMLDEQAEYFIKLLTSEEVPVPSSPDMAVTDCVQPPFSDKLMLYHTSVLGITHLRNYTDAITTSLRSDIIAGFTRLSVEASKYAAEGAKLMVNFGWMEEPPQVVNHKELIGV